MWRVAGGGWGYTNVSSPLCITHPVVKILIDKFGFFNEEFIQRFCRHDTVCAVFLFNVKIKFYVVVQALQSVIENHDLINAKEYKRKKKGERMKNKKNELFLVTTLSPMS